MSYPTNDMPARIWATGNDHTGCWNVRDVQTCPGVEYIRADAALALVAAEREACADIASENAAATVKAAAIRSRTPSDALAALEARDKRVRWEALREGRGVTVDELAQIIRTVDGSHNLGAGELAERILSALSPAPVSDAEPMHDDAPAAIIREIGNQIHNLGCECQNDKALRERLSELASRTWQAAKMVSTEAPATLSETEGNNK